MVWGFFSGVCGGWGGTCSQVFMVGWENGIYVELSGDRGFLAQSEVYSFPLQEMTPQRGVREQGDLWDGECKVGFASKRVSDIPSDLSLYRSALATLILSCPTPQAPFCLPQDLCTGYVLHRMPCPCRGVAGALSLSAHA